jgi:hypothetical protein
MRVATLFALGIDPPVAAFELGRDTASGNLQTQDVDAALIFGGDGTLNRYLPELIERQRKRFRARARDQNSRRCRPRMAGFSQWRMPRHSRGRGAGPISQRPYALLLQYRRYRSRLRY